MLTVERRVVDAMRRCSFIQLERSYQRFTAFYASRHSGRKLTWLYQLSKGELVTNCFKNRYTLQVKSSFNLACVCGGGTLVLNDIRQIIEIQIDSSGSEMESIF